MSILTLILSMLAFLIDVLLFVPHMAFGSYLVLAATVLIAASGVVSCAMRRTLVGRKARKRRIEENAEMNGQNYYNRQAVVPIDGAMAPAAPTMVNGAPGGDKLPAFATFENPKDEDQSEEQIPLTTRTPSNPSPHNNFPDNQRGGSPPRDRYGNPLPLPPPGQYSRNRDPSREPPLNRQYSENSMGPRGRGGMGPGGYRGRGGYPNSRGGYNAPRGGPGNYGRGGGYRGGPNDNMGPMGGGPMMRGGRGGPQGLPGYGPPPGQSYSRDASPAGPYRAYGQQQGYGADPGVSPMTPGYPGNVGNVDDVSDLARAESPPPLPGMDQNGDPIVGRAVEMDATSGSPSRSPVGFNNNQFQPIRASDGDVAGMVGLQQHRMSETSRYSQSE